MWAGLPAGFLEIQGMLQNGEASVLAEVAVERDCAPESEPFREDETRNVNQAEPLIAIPEDDLDRSPFVLGRGPLDLQFQLAEPPGGHVAPERLSMSEYVSKRT